MKPARFRFRVAGPAAWAGLVVAGLGLPPGAAAERSSPTGIDASRQAVEALDAFFRGGGDLGGVPGEPFASVPLARGDSLAARQRLAAARLAEVRESRQAERRAALIVEGDLRMPFFVRTFGKAPAGRRSLFISLHGGGGAPPQVNDSQWENQKRLYEPAEGIYVAPRAPSDTWNLWHQGHIDGLLDRLIDVLAVTEGADRNRVYLLGYSAGGDGVYQLAPRMADRWAAAAMMAGHPNDASPLGLRNVPFALQVGGRDAAFDRNAVAADWERKLAALRRDDPGGYEHFVRIDPRFGHWMNREDAVAIPWMAKHVRNPVPSRVVWRQDDVTHSRFSWLAVADEDRRSGTQVVAEVAGQEVSVESSDLGRVTILLDDRLVDLDRPVTIVANGRRLPARTVERTIAGLARTLAERGDPDLSFSAAVTVELAGE